MQLLKHNKELQMATFDNQVVKAIRAELKRTLPKYRFQIKKGYVLRWGNSSYSVDITVIHGPFDFVEDRLADGSNHLITRYTSNKDLFSRIITAVQTAGLINAEWPLDYIYVSIGTHEKPYVIK